MLYDIEIKEAFKSLNSVLRYSWHKRYNAGRRWRRMIGDELLCCGYRVPLEPYEFAHVIITRYSSRLLDYDNLVGGAKLIVDALKCPVVKYGKGESLKVVNKSGLGFIKDDDPSCVKLEYRQEIRREPGTRIEIKELERC